MIMGEEHCGPGGCKLRIAGVSKVFEGRRGTVSYTHLRRRGTEFSVFLRKWADLRHGPCRDFKRSGGAVVGQEWFRR